MAKVLTVRTKIRKNETKLFFTQRTHFYTELYPLPFIITCQQGKSSFLVEVEGFVIDLIFKYSGIQ